MRVAAHYFRRSPAAHLLQRIQRRAVLHVPARPRMPQVMPAEVLNTGALQGGVPALRADLLDRLPAKAEHVGGMLAEPLRISTTASALSGTALYALWLGRRTR